MQIARDLGTLSSNGLSPSYPCLHGDPVEEGAEGLYEPEQIEDTEKTETVAACTGLHRSVPDGAPALREVDTSAHP